MSAPPQHDDGERPRGTGGPPGCVEGLAGLPIRRGDPNLKGARGRHGRGLAIVVGIDAYNEDLRLYCARRDAEKIGETLRNAHGYDTVECLDGDATRQRLLAIAEAIPAAAKHYQRFVFFFSGHGRADLTEDDRLVGSLLPCDARRDDPGTLFPMSTLRDAISALEKTACRHVLIILDCCSAGAFARTREAAAARPRLAQARYEWVTRHAAAQVLASAGHDEVAFDSIAARKESDQQNSPFTTALLGALRTSDADANRDGVVLATDLYVFVQKVLLELQLEHLQRAQQTPMFFTLPWHEGGDFGFLLEDEPAWREPVHLDSASIPYTGLRPFGEGDAGVFSGRTALIKDLAAKAAEPGRAFLVLTGASGVGKSSLLAAGLVPRLREEQEAWAISSVLRVGSDPAGVVLAALRSHLPRWDGEDAPDAAVRAWAQAERGTLVLVLDQLEELITRVEAPAAKELARLVHDLVQTGHVKVLGAVRAGFDAEILALFGEDLAAVLVPPMNREELREVIERPAEERVLFFDDEKRGGRALVDFLLDAVEALPGSLPLLSLTLNALCLRYLQSGREDRKLLWADFQAIGGVAGALTRIAEGVYERTIDAQGRAVRVPADAGQLALHQATVRRVLLRMVEGGPNGWARRRVARDELDTEPTAEARERTDVVLGMLVSARLVVESAGSYEPAHDLLIEGWPRLRSWLAVEGERVLATRELTDAAEDWQAGSQPLAMLWGDRRLARVARLRRKEGDGAGGARALEPQVTRRLLEYFVPDRFVAALEPDWLTEVERAFVRKSVAHRRNKSLLAALLGLGVIGAVAALFFAATAREQSSATAELNQLVAAARLVRDDPTRIAEAVTRALAAYAERQQRYGRHPPEALVHLSEIAEHRSSLPVGAADVPGRVVDVRVDEDGMAALVYHDQRVRLLRLDGDGRVREIPLTPPPSNATEGRFSPDGRLVAGIVPDAIQLWETSDGAGRSQFASPGAAGSPAFSADGKRLAAHSDGAGVRVWDLERGGDPRVVGAPALIAGIALDRHGTQLAVAPAQGLVQLVKEGSQEPPRLLPAPDGDQTNVIAFSPDGRWMVTGRTDNQVLLWKPDEPELVSALGEHREAVNVAAFDPAGDRVVSGGSDHLCRLWNVAGRSRERSAGPTVLVGSGSAIEVASFTSNGRGVVAHANGEAVRLWSAEPVGLRLELAHPGAVTTAVYSPDGRFVLTGSVDRTARVWSLREGRLRWRRTHAWPINAAAFGPDGTWLVEAPHSTEEPSAYLWVGDSEKPRLLSGYHTHPIVAIKVSHDGRIATASLDGTVQIWRSDGEHLASLEHSPLERDDRRRLHQGGVLDVAWSADGDLLVTAGADGQAEVWDARRYTKIAAHAGHTGEVTSASFSADCAVVLTASADGTAHLWRASSGSLIASLTGSAGRVTKARFVPGSDLAATTGDDGSVRLWRVPSGRLVHVLEGHTGPVIDIAPSPSGEQLASGGRDGKVLLWDLRQGALEASFDAHGGGVTAIAYRGDGRRVISAGDDGFVRVFPTSAEEPLDRLCEALVEAPRASEPERGQAERFCAGRRLLTARDFGAAWRRLYP
ncbi:caspase family protein [Sorangium sp. So ce134]